MPRSGCYLIYQYFITSFTESMKHFLILRRFSQESFVSKINDPNITLFARISSVITFWHELALSGNTVNATYMCVSDNRLVNLHSLSFPIIYSSSQGNKIISLCRITHMILESCYSERPGGTWSA